MAAMFVGFVFLPGLGAMLRLDKSKNSLLKENRFLAGFPAWPASVAGIRPFVSGLESYFNDHFGFRERLIYWAQTWKRDSLKETWQYKVIIGQDGWLYSAQSENPFEERRIFTTVYKVQELAAWREIFELRREWLARRGIKYLLVFAPDKQTIYPEHLPAWAAELSRRRKLDQFLQYMRTNSNVPIVDLAPVLWQAKSEGPTYYRTDSHWNAFGAFVAANEIIRALSQALPGLKPLQQEDFERSVRSEPGGNLAWMLTGSEKIVETDAPEFVPKLGLPQLEMSGSSYRGSPVHRCENPLQKGEALLFCDSFADGLLPFLGYHFNQVSLYRLYEAGGAASGRPVNDFAPAHVWVPGIIEQEAPEVVIDEILEGLFYQENPETLKTVDGLDR